MVDESLSGEPAEQALDDPLLKVKVNNFIGHVAGVLEHDRPDGRGTPPFPRLLIVFSRCPQRVHRVAPGRIGTFTLVERREAIAGGAVFGAI